jgi:hypothetical protein
VPRLPRWLRCSTSAKADFTLLRKTLDGDATEDVTPAPTAFAENAPATAVTFVASAGYVWFVSRNIYWIFSAFTTTPAWGGIDPLALLDEWEREAKDKEVETMFD